MENFLDKIVSIKPREKAGSTAYNRFDYQQNWAICKLLELYSTTEDFLMCFDYHDDIILMDSSNDPKKISFYQIKTTSKKNWSLSDLLKTRSSKDGLIINSFLGKLFYNYTIFPDYTDSINFISNASYKINLADETDSTIKNKINGIDISEQDILKINSALKNELRLDEIPEFEQITIFEVTQLTIDHHEELTKIQLANFIESTFPGTNYQLSTIYKTIFGEIKRKATYEKHIVDQESLVNYKSISRKDLEYYLKVGVLDKRQSFKDKCDRIENRLNSEKVDFTFIRTFKQNCTLIEIERMNRNNRLFENINKTIKKVVASNIATGINGDLFDCMVTIYESYELLNIRQNSYDENYIKALIIIELYEIG